MQVVFKCERSRRIRQRARLRRGGFSLVELLVVTALVASSAMAGTPVLSTWQARDRVDGAARALLASLTLARGEAIARGARVVVCPADARAQCLPKGHVCERALRGWSCGWMVVVEQGPGGRVLRVHRRMSGVSIAAAAPAIEFTPPAGQVIGGFRKIEFTAAGVNASGPQSASSSRCIRVAAGGRARLERGACSGRARA